MYIKYSIFNMYIFIIYVYIYITYNPVFQNQSSPKVLVNFQLKSQLVLPEPNERDAEHMSKFHRQIHGKLQNNVFCSSTFFHMFQWFPISLRHQLQTSSQRQAGKPFLYLCPMLFP